MPPPQTGIHGPLLLEEPLIRTPYELLRRSHRSAQRQVERDFVAVQSQLSNLLKSLDGSDGDKDAALAKLDVCGERVRGLKRKLDDLQPAPDGPGAAVLRERLRHVDTALLAPARAAEVEKARERERDLAALAGKTTDGEDKEEEKVTESGGGGAGSGMDVDDAGDAGEAEVEAAAAATEDKSETLEAAKARAKAVVAEHFEKKSTSSATAAPLARDPADRTLDRYIVDHLMRTRRMKTAKTLAAAQGIEALVDVKLFAELVRIETALIDKHSVAEALAWCGENRGTLKKQASDLEFTLRMQEFIELCRRRETETAIAYARKNLAPWAATHMPDLQQGMTLLAFGEKTGVQTYRKLYDAARWADVRQEFRDTFLGIYALPSQSLLALSLSAGLSSLRLPACAPSSRPSAPKEERAPALPQPLLPPPPAADVNTPAPDMVSLLSLPETPTPPAPAAAAATDDKRSPPSAHAANVDCPTCNDHMRVLAREVPMGHHVNSTLVCRISGDVMDSNNEPMAFPNGCVYSSKALAEMAKTNFDVVTCPRTGASCAFSHLRKVYIS